MRKKALEIFEKYQLKINICIIRISESNGLNCIPETE